MPKICLYIPCRNGEKTLPEVFAAMAAQTRQADVRLLVNDQSTDNTADMATQAGWTVVDTAPARNGLAAGRNVAASFANEAGCDVLAGIDADAVPATDYMETLHRVFATNRNLAGVCGNMQERHTQTASDQWRAVYMAQHYGDASRANPPILYGSSAAHRLEAVFAVGGFNEALRTNYEDTDLTQRLLAAGHSLAYVPELRLEHLKQDTPDTVLRMFWQWYFPPADLSGFFGSGQAWLINRLPWIWSDYRRRARHDAAHPRLTLITCALPWVQVVRDLALLASRLNTPANFTPVLGLAVAVHRDCGFPEPLVAWLTDRIRYALHQAQATQGDLINPAILSAIRDASLESVPRRAFWPALDESWSDLECSLAVASS